MCTPSKLWFLVAFFVGIAQSQGLPEDFQSSSSASPYQWSVNGKYFGLTFHPGGGNDDPQFQYPRRLDAEAYWVLQVGTEVDVDWLHKDLPWLGLRLTNAVFLDCIDVWSGHVHFGPRFQHRFASGLGFSIGLGPTLLWRENWWLKKEVSWYNGDGFYGKKETQETYQTAFLWYGGNLEASWMFHQDWGLVYSLVPGWPQVLTSSAGLRYAF
jgi:hypothetical protein